MWQDGWSLGKESGEWQRGKGGQLCTPAPLTFELAKPGSLSQMNSHWVAGSSIPPHLPPPTTSMPLNLGSHPEARNSYSQIQ